MQSIPLIKAHIRRPDRITRLSFLRFDPLSPRGRRTFPPRSPPRLPRAVLHEVVTGRLSLLPVQPQTDRKIILFVNISLRQCEEASDQVHKAFTTHTRGRNVLQNK